MKQRLKITLALALNLAIGTTPLASFASGPSPAKINSPSKSERFLRLHGRPRPSNQNLSRSSGKIEGQTTTLLADGRMLLVGGTGPDGEAVSSKISDPRNGESILLTEKSLARSWHSATMLPDGRVLIVGGFRANGKVLEKTGIFDPEKLTFQELPKSALTPRAYHTATLLTDGRVLIAGGVSAKNLRLAKAELWNFKTQTSKSTTGESSAQRAKAQATLLADGNVLIEGGFDENGSEVGNCELFNSEAESFNFTTISDRADAERAFVTASLPRDGATEVELDSLIALRFSKPLNVEFQKSETLKLSSEGRLISAKVTFAEGGRLAFLLPAQPLDKGVNYTVAVGDESGANGLIPAVVSFTTAGDKKDEGNQELLAPPPGDVDWAPDADNLRGNWRSKGEKSIWENQPPLRGKTGETALSGQVLTLRGKPLPGVTISVNGLRTHSDNTGRFLLPAIPSGHQVMLIDGSSASQPGATYGIFRAGVEVTSNETNVLPFTIWMPKLDMAHAATIPSPNKKDLVITNPLIPGLELHLPTGTVIRDLDGRAVTQISITPVPTDRPPFPLPPGFSVPVFASIQPGGARVIPPRAQLIYPNYTNKRAGARVNFWNYDPEEKGWYIYGQGTVTKNAKQIIPDPGVVVYEFTGIMIGDGGDPPDDWPNPGSGPGGEDGDPVDLATGLFVQRKTDLAVADVLPITLRRTYRPGDNASRAFGIGATHPYDMFLYSVNNYQELDVILPDGGRVHYVRISPGTGFTDAVYEHTSTPSAFYKSRISWVNGTWELKLKDGTVYVFPEFAALHAIRDRFGNQITMTRTAGNYGYLTQITSSNGRWIQFTNDFSYRISQAKDNTGRTVDYTYDSGGRLWKVTGPTGGVTEYTYDSSNRMLTIKDARGIVYLTNEYNSAGRVTKQTQADSSTYEFAYTLTSGKVTQTDVTDPRGNVRRVTFNPSGYSLSETRALGDSEEQVFTFTRQSGNNFLLTATDPLSRTTALTYDSMGNVASVTRLSGTSAAVTTAITHEPTFSQVASVTDPLSHTTTYGYDPRGNLTSITNPLSQQTALTHNASGEVLSVTNPLSHSFQFTYDSGDLVTITDPLGRTTTRAFDGQGRPIRVTDPLGKQTGFDYDKLNERTQTKDALQGVTAFTYDENGNLLSVTDARNNVTSYAYNNMDRVTTRTDPLSHDETYQYDENGNLTQVTDRKGQVKSYTYDALNRLKQVTYDDSSTISYTRDGGNRLTQMVDSISGTITLAYDDLDRLTSATTPQGTISYTYDAAGRRTAMTISGQSAINYTYDNANRLTQISQGSATVTIAYDAAGQKTSVTLPNGIVTEYGYSVASELTSLDYKLSGSVIGNLTYAYDASGRRTKFGGSYATTGVPQALATTTYNAANQITQRGSTTLTYDLNGNLTGDGSNTYTWNARNKLASISGSVSASFQYDAFGRRVSRTVGGTTLGYLHDRSNVVQQLSGTTPVANLITGRIDEVFTRTDSAGTRCFLSTHLRSTLSLADNSGAVVTQYKYEPFGQTTITGSSNANSFQYTGRENDATGLYFYRARYYSPLLQRFISEDPIGFAGGDANLYAYVKNNPINLSDPLGLDPPQDPPDHPELTPEEIAAGEGAKIPAEALGHGVGARGLPIAGGLGGLAPGLYYYVEKMNERDREIQDLCCTTHHCECTRPPNDPNDPNGDPNDPNNPQRRPYDPNNPGAPYDPNDPNAPTGPRKP